MIHALVLTQTDLSLCPPPLLCLHSICVVSCTGHEGTQPVAVKERNHLTRPPVPGLLPPHRRSRVRVLPQFALHPLQLLPADGGKRVLLRGLFVLEYTCVVDTRLWGCMDDGWERCGWHAKSNVHDCDNGVCVCVCVCVCVRVSSSNVCAVSPSTRPHTRVPSTPCHIMPPRHCYGSPLKAHTLVSNTIPPCSAHTGQESMPGDRCQV